jgi:acetylornithine deacetylase/succinyl-diaminopimelate desuccinylase-like protein
VGGNLRVDILTEGVHSGDATGIVASSFRILRQVLSRVEDEATGHIKVDALHVEIPKERREQAREAAKVLEEEVFTKFPWVPGAKPVSEDGAELVLNRTWRPALAVTGVDGMPALSNAGNVLRPFTTFKLSMRIPPRLDPKAGMAALKATLEKDPPYGAKVTFEGEKTSVGWDAPPLAGWLSKAVESASKTYFGRPAMAMGEGGTIPFMGMLGERFPEAQFVITGLLGPGSNAHGPNEFLHIPTGKKLTCCVASVIADHFKR